ncbi:MAG TPA: N-formylglutamate amidohydrolase [Acidobacteriaceae bacterium]|nr:N-formylglutamate amidohydrolase [Acidobacteriaceae bacterium]
MSPRVLRPEGKSRFVILCDHASRHIPAELHDLGLPTADLAHHIAWDIGAAGVTEALSEIFDAPAVLSPVSRLVIDCNRHLDAADLIPECSDGTVIPGNLNLAVSARVQRIEHWFHSYHAAVETILDERATPGADAIVLSIHSMTDNLAGSRRPWQIAFSSHEDRSLVQPMIDILRQSSDIEVGDNQPYSMDPAIDYSIPFHALRRNLPYLQVEFRQDEVQDAQAQLRWAKRFASALAEALP